MKTGGARFNRTELLLGREAVARLAAARVVVAGLGAVGSYAIEALARSGVGHLRIVDFDEIRESNINRQLYALESTLGRAKVDAAAARIRDINPACEVDARKLFIGDESAASVVADRPDVLIDAIDSVNPKVSLLLAARAAGVGTIISSMGAAQRVDAASVRVGDISETDRCPLARMIRKKLKKKGVESGIVCIYSTELPLEMEASAAVPHEEPVLRRGRLRRTLGSLATIPGIFGLTAANEAIAVFARDARKRRRGARPTGR